MKRRRFLTAIGAGSVGTGALVGTGSYDTIRSQRRVKLEVDGKPRLDLRGISFVAFCPEHEGIEIEVLSVNEDGDAVEIRWTAPEPFTGDVILKGGPEWWLFEFEDATEGTAIMDEPGTLLCDECPSRVVGDEFDRCPSSPCLGESGTKFEADDGFVMAETTGPDCP